ncbi:MAG TPA: xanthine dehydrogenase family protein molybdopterin-binding subunit [Xanthobacteraceae bacterium]|jgi:carbon-monoxide dehydrogenase large subunit|nr:xanthine dehydrogenase family protein molybdopterin-binding subunit [Xanthobacteraceae bacterium]
MNLRSDPDRWESTHSDATDRWAVAKFGIGQPVRRTEDPKLVRGEGRFTDDVAVAGQAYAVMVRSRYAHGIIRGIETQAARAMPGVLAVYTGADLAAAGYGKLKCIVPFNNRDGSPMRKPARPALPTDKVRFVGDPIACVVAESLMQAKDAAEAIELDIEPLPAVIDPEEAARPEAPQLYADVPGNIALDYHYGDSAAVAEAFARAAHVTRLKLINSRVVVNAMEPRAALASYAHGRFTLYVPSQGVFGMRAQVAQVMGVEPGQVHVITGNIGGSFGMKAAVYSEYVCALHAARELGRPVKWTDERSGSFVSDHHGRDHRVSAELALDADGNFLAVRLTSFGNMGAFLANVGPMPPTLNAVKNVQNVYRTPLIEVSTKCVFTNTSHVSAYRGAGRPEGNYYMERLIDTAAAEMNIDRLELRRRNQIKRRHLPFKAASGMTYDSGDFPALLREALDAADTKGFARRKRESKKRGKLRGLGIGSFLEVTAPPSKELGGITFEADGSVTLTTGTMDFGMGHAAPFAQVLSEKLGIPFDKIRLVQGDSDRLVIGGGSGGSKSIMSSGTAIVEASAKVVEQGRQIASHVLEASAADIEFKNGTFVIAGTDHAIGIMDLAAKIHAGLNLPEGTPASLDVSHVSEGAASTFPNGCHIAEVEVDPDTGQIAVVKYSCVNDFGTVINPMIVEGQLHGGTVQGIGQALMEMTVYDAEGQFLTGSYMDYALPRAADVPSFAVADHPVPATTNPLGVKGCGEAGCAGALTSVMNAVVDALSELGIRHIDMPATPFRVWQAIHAARTQAA